MNIQVRYYSRSGNTKALAEAIAQAAHATAISVDQTNANINEPTDFLFVGGALYAYGIDHHLKSWLNILDASKVKKAVVFSTSRLSKYSIDVIKKTLQNKGITVLEETIYYKNHPTDAELEEAKNTVKKIIQ